MEPHPTTQYATAKADDSRPFKLSSCGHLIGRIHYDDARVPYLHVTTDYGGEIRIYGDAIIRCCCGQVGHWHPGAEAMAKMIAAYGLRDARIAALIAELKTLL